jgi:molybdopterin/thiamine biosynthesis adenylyltransferase/rhodanese-related sulfurtransferase/molybdopterin converting factor small subunit
MSGGVTVHLPAALRDYAGGATAVAVAGGTVAAALADLVRRHPRLRRHLFDEAAALRGFVNVYLNETDVKELESGIDTPLGDGDALTIVPSVAGGATDAPARPAVPLSPAELGRYARHIVLPEVGREGQQRLKAARVAVVGAGGLGSPVGLYLAAAGIGTIGLIDDDAVDASNLQRQVLYGTADLGRAKTEAAAARLRDVNPHIELVEHPVRLTSANAMDVLAGYDVIVDGTDNFPTRYLVNDACVLLGRPYVYGSIFRFDGQVSVFDAARGPCYRCLFREPPPPGLVPSCAEGGVLGVLPGIIGSVQALETIKLVLGIGEPLVGRLLVFDALGFRWRELRLQRSRDCPICGPEPTLTGLIDYDAFCGLGGPDMTEAGTAAQPDELTPVQLEQRLRNGEPLQLIDVREPYEWDIANLGPQGARLIPLGDLPDRLDELEAGADIVIYCRSGGRSAGAVRHLRARGFQRVYNLKGGILGWAEDVDPDMATY